MKQNIWLLCLTLLAGCQSIPQVNVAVSNGTDLNRTTETVTVEWATLTERIPDLTPANVVVTNEAGEQIPAQAIPGNVETPTELIFQVQMGPKSEQRFTIAKGTPVVWPVRVTGRHVPERVDDYAWENNLVPFRMYGPGLDPQLKSIGIDVWAKNVERIVTSVDDWFTRTYHIDQGEGMDCYKVGSTLGCGATAPYVDGKLWLDSNYSTWETIDDGPVRITFKLTYNALPVKDGIIKMEKIISLDYDQYLNKIQTWFTSDSPQLQVATGIIRHDVVSDRVDNECVVISEIPSDSKKDDPKEDGLQHLALLMPEANGTYEVIENHSCIVNQVKPGEIITCYTGGAWSKAGKLATAESWNDYIKNLQQMLETPLQISLD